MDARTAQKHNGSGHTTLVNGESIKLAVKMVHTCVMLSLYHNCDSTMKKSGSKRGREKEAPQIKNDAK